MYYFGRTVETLLLRFGKVPGPLPDLGCGRPSKVFCKVSTFGTRPRKKSWSPWRGA